MPHTSPSSVVDDIQTSAMLYLCSTCHDLEQYAPAYTNPDPKHLTVGVLKQVAITCPSGGCKILLNAISKCIPEALNDNYYHVRPCLLDFGEFGIHPLGEIKLFVTEGTSESFERMGRNRTKHCPVSVILFTQRLRTVFFGKI
jgi:hypothetical protein